MLALFPKVCYNRGMENPVHLVVVSRDVLRARRGCLLDGLFSYAIFWCLRLFSLGALIIAFYKGNVNFKSRRDSVDNVDVHTSILS